MLTWDKITIHCSATPNGQHVTVGEIRSWHIKRGFTDIGYHWVIYASGTMRVGRPSNELGAHVKGANLGNLGLCMIGNDKFSESQFKTLQELVLKLTREWGMEDNDVMAHYQFASAIKQNKTCPNMNIDKLRRFIFWNDWDAIKPYILHNDT